MKEKRSRIAKASLSPECIIGTVGLLASFSTMLGLLVVALGEEKACNGLISAAAAFSLSGAATFFAVSIFQEKIARAKRPILIYIEIVGLVSTSIVGVLGLGHPLAIIFILLSACGSSCLVCTWFCWICAQPSPRSKLLIGAACLCSCAACLIMDSLEGSFLREAAICTVYALSIISAFVIRRYGVTVNRFPFVGNKESDSRSKILPESTVKFSLDSFQFGMVIGIACSAGYEPLCLLCGMVVAAIYLFDASRTRVITERNMSMFISPMAVIAIFCMFLFGQIGQIIALCIMSSAYVLITCVGWMAMVGHVNISSLSPLRIFSKARRIQYCFISMGIVIGLVLFELAKGSFEGWIASIQICFVIGAAFVFTSSVLHRSRFPEMGLEEDNSDDAIASRSVSWLKRCRAFSEANGLSERQTEVLILIAQGRSAKYVQEELSISLSTAQTHIRNIYRKAGCHSRQELMSEIENTKLYGEE